MDIDFDFEHIDRTPNSLDSHRLVMLAERDGVANALVERLFINYFLYGRDIGARSVLCETAAEVGLDMVDAAAYLDTPDDIEYVYNANTRALRLGVNGVPAFVFNGSMVIAGAQGPKVLARVLDAAVINAGADEASLFI